MHEAVSFSVKRPVLIDRFLEDATEVDVDALCDGENVLLAGIMEHIEEAGVHSGDSSCVLPPISISASLKTIEDYTARLARALNVIGLMNVQYALKDGHVYVLEVNPRASRTVPFVSKATGVPLPKIAVGLMLGKKLTDFTELIGNNVNGTLPVSNFFVKSPVFPFAKFPGVDPALGPEMRSTGEVMGVGESFGEAFAKAQLAAGSPIPDSGALFISVNDRDKRAAVEAATKFRQFGFELFATRGTAAALKAAGLPCKTVFKVNAKMAAWRLPGGQLMMLALKLSPETEEKLRERATRAGLTLEAYLEQLAAEAVASRRRDPIRVWSLQELHAAAAMQASSA